MNAQLRFAQIIAVYPQRRTCEAVFLEDGWRCNDVQILYDYVSNNTGAWSMHNMARPPSELLAGGLNPDEGKRTVLGVVAMVEGRPLLVGFLPHPLTQIEFIEEQQNRDLHWRHPSGTYWTTSPNGSWELCHTGGAFLRIAIDSDDTPADEHEDLTPYSANENWELPRNDPPTITLVTEGFRMRVKPGGDTEIISAGNLSVRYRHDVEITAGDNLEIRAHGNADVLVGGDATVRVAGSLTATAQGDITANAEGAAHVVAQGDATVHNAGDVDVTTMGSASLTSAGGVTVETEGAVDVFAGAGISLESPTSIDLTTVGPMTLTASEITANTALLTVVGEEDVLGQAEVVAIELIALAIVMAARLVAVAANLAIIAPELAQVAMLVAQIMADNAQTLADAQDAEERANAASEPAKGTGEPTPD